VWAATPVRPGGWPASKASSHAGERGAESVGEDLGEVAESGSGIQRGTAGQDVLQRGALVLARSRPSAQEEAPCGGAARRVATWPRTIGRGGGGVVGARKVMLGAACGEPALQAGLVGGQSAGAGAGSPGGCPARRGGWCVARLGGFERVFWLQGNGSSGPDQRSSGLAVNESIGPTPAGELRVPRPGIDRLSGRIDDCW
jgi:hypothetical protein